jgi:hypothetical protein
LGFGLGKKSSCFWLAADDIPEMFTEIIEMIAVLSDIKKEAEAMNIEMLKQKIYLEDSTDPDAIKEDLRQAREINSIQVTVRNCISCLRKVRMLKVVIRKSIDVPGSVFDTQKFLKKYTVENFKEY